VQVARRPLDPRPVLRGRDSGRIAVSSPDGARAGPVGYASPVDASENWLLTARLREVHARLLADPSAAAAGAAWRIASDAVAAAGATEDEAAALPVLLRDAAALGLVLDAWDARRVPLPEWDQAVLKRAMNAFKKRLKLTRADDDISSSRNPLTRGASSSIVGVKPPEAYGPEVWALLVRHGRLRDAGDGLLEPASGA
jgi:hypothetical protein